MPEITTTHQQYVQVVCMLVEVYWFYLATKTLKVSISRVFVGGKVNTKSMLRNDSSSKPQTSSCMYVCMYVLAVQMV